MRVAGTPYEVIPLGKGDELHYRVVQERPESGGSTFVFVLPVKFPIREHAVQAARQLHRGGA